MPRSRIEGLLASFPKLVASNAQHTTVETESVRYVYQPLEAVYMVIITNKASNILQDIETLHLFARVVGDVCRVPEEKEIIRNAFELICAFDEVVSLGYRENVNLQQIRTIIEMDSHEEKIQEMIARDLLAVMASPDALLTVYSRNETQGKELEAKEVQKRKAKQIEMQKREAAKRGSASGGLGSSFGGPFGSSAISPSGRSPVVSEPTPSVSSFESL
ncbi:MAG: coatomer delta subunit Ret2 [Olpidium bornovanus]|uniref:Coatomer subunit delta n=1 Tax=Olpidium bornovanus TaxID=278681 RepID=A0A8H7ZYA9_9FUNG|nr:MAG: coatomer delta subunit Ret2 [Olpidium bornovanus]